MKKNIAIISAIAVILLAGCSPRANEEGENSQVQNSSENSTFSSENSENSSSNLTNDFSSSSSYLNNNNYSSNNNNFKPDSGSSSELSSQSAENSSSLSSSSSSSSSQSSSQSTPAQSSSSTPAQSTPASSSSNTAASAGNLAPENNPYPGYKYVEDPDANGATVYGIKTNDPDQGTYTPTDTSNLPPEAFDENGFAYTRNGVFVDKNGVKWRCSAVTGWYISGTEPDVSHEPGYNPNDPHGGTVPGAY